MAPGTTNGVARRLEPSVNGVQMPALDIEVQLPERDQHHPGQPGPRSASRTRCGQTWYPAIRTDASTNTSRARCSFPGQPYGATYSICADDSGYRRIQTATNTDFTNGTTVR